MIKKIFGIVRNKYVQWVVIMAIIALFLYLGITAIIAEDKLLNP